MIILQIILINFLYFVFTINKFFSYKKFSKKNINLYINYNKYYICELLLTLLNLVFFNLKYENIKIICIINNVFILYLFFKQSFLWNKLNNLKIYNFSGLNVNLLLNLMLLLSISFSKYFSVLKINIIVDSIILFCFMSYVQIFIFLLSSIYNIFKSKNIVIKYGDNVWNDIFYDYVNKNFNELFVGVVLICINFPFFILLFLIK